ncbi:MAG: hypothetical protein ACRDD1_04915 [Planctomycetia bacterium]
MPPRGYLEKRLAGVAFAHPADWPAELKQDDDGALAVMQSDGAGFAIVGVYDAAIDPDDVVNESLESLRDEHPGLELEDLEDPLPAGGVGTEVVFFSIDKVSFCWLAAWRLPKSTVLAMVQSVEEEADAGRKVFRGLCKSIAPADPER